MTPAFSSLNAFLAMGGYALYVWLAVVMALAVFGLLAGHTLWQRRVLFENIRRQHARRRRMTAARREKESADANAS